MKMIMLLMMFYITIRKRKVLVSGCYSNHNLMDLILNDDYNLEMLE